MNAYTDAVERGLEGFTHESVGTLEGCDQCPEGEDEGQFSWSSCEVCGAGLGGDRYAAHALDAEGNIVHFDICVDCVAYIANGEEPTSGEWIEED